MSKSISSYYNDDSIFSSTLTENIKTAIVDDIKVETKVNLIKGSIINKINGISCDDRRLDVMEIEQDGFQRILQGPETTFAALSESLLALDGVKSAGKLLSSISIIYSSYLLLLSLSFDVFHLSSSSSAQSHPSPS